jgi:hypothetical protein
MDTPKMGAFDYALLEKCTFMCAVKLTMLLLDILFRSLDGPERPFCDV